MADNVSRREFVSDAGRLALGAMIVPRHVLGGPGFVAPSDTLNYAVVGFGGMGSNNAQELSKTENLIAVCDVDWAYAEGKVAGMLADRNGRARPEGVKLQSQFVKAKRYEDFREMLDREKGIDGVIVATPDHLHAVVAKAAMDRGKHVYVQKPLTYSVHEARVLRETAARNPKIVTQMGNQGHSTEGARLINEWIQAGVIGPVREVHVWTNRPVVYWPQAVPRPNSYPIMSTSGPFGNPWSNRHVNEVLSAAMGEAQVPPGMRWDLYLGPVKEDIPYHPIYHPFNWRGWVEFGASALGDMGAHLLDQPFWALNLGAPTSIEATSTPWGTIPVPADPAAAAGSPASRSRSRPVSYPISTAVHYHFPARGAQPAVKLMWFDGGVYPPRPDVLPDDVVLQSEGGVIFIGDAGILINETYGANPQIYPQSLMASAVRVPRSIPRIDWSHELNWAKAIKGQAQASSPFEYSARLTETMLLGIAALRAGQGRKLYYDADASRFTNAPDADQYLTRNYRAGWAI